MNLRRALFIAAFVLPTAAGPALAQVQPRQAPASPFDQPPQRQDEPPCMKDFAKLRDEVEKHGAAVMAGQKNKVPLPEACKLLTAFAASQERFLAYAKKNEVWCGIPPQLIQQISAGSRQRGQGAHQSLPDGGAAAAAAGTEPERRARRRLSRIPATSRLGAAPSTP